MVKIEVHESPLYVDGSCDPHKTKMGGFAVVQACWDDSHNRDPEHIISCGTRQNTTNNEMELTAIYQAIKWIHGRGIKVPKEIRSDSNYAIKCVTEWVHNWSWISGFYYKKNGDVVANSKLIHKIIELLKECQCEITFTHVKAHANDEWNNFADLVANDMRVRAENGQEILVDEFPEEQGGEKSSSDNKEDKCYEIQDAINGVLNSNPVTYVWYDEDIKFFIIDINIEHQLEPEELNLIPIIDELKSMNATFISVCETYAEHPYGDDPEWINYHVVLQAKIKGA